jgi:hypothetical protein
MTLIKFPGRAASKRSGADAKHDLPLPADDLLAMDEAALFVEETALEERLRDIRAARGTIRRLEVMPKHDAAAWDRAFGQRMRRARVTLGISEAAAAAACLITTRTYRRWETGLRHRNPVFGLISFSKKYNVSLEWLLGGPGREPRPLPKLAAVDGKSALP